MVQRAKLGGRSVHNDPKELRRKAQQEREAALRPLVPQLRLTITSSLPSLLSVQVVWYQADGKPKVYRNTYTTW